MQENPFAGVGLHAVGAFSAASCYTPQKQTKFWSWEIYWLSQATCAWLILPIAFAFLTVPNYVDVVRECPEAARRSFFFGLAYGIGGLSFGLGIRYIGFSLNYAIAIGISAGLGTLAPLIYHANKGFTGEIVDKFSNLPGWIILGGILISLVGIAVCGWAGALRERSAGSGPSRFSFKIGVPLAILAGIFSAVFAYALQAGDPLASEAFKAGSYDLLKMNATYPFSHGGAWVVSAVWCIFLMVRNKSGSQLVRLPDAGTGRLAFYYLMALLSGAFWYFQFFFYGMGRALIGTKNDHTSWALHMAMLILFSNVFGVLFREWKDAGKKARWTLQAGMAIIVIATIIIAIGLTLGEQPPTAE